ncbi:YihY/virulence factor BrkB family protein [Flammeovirga agarivorans]|uniref:YihY/virulence factor BrkB family protein n=1 Tax=Flammeovirga agarivorans TaxID=2726742 RepID=A0A7X8XXF6_9BACT|nr:YihY/virulence factor BrkB family protein [Flammeovirga agarivorans]NLR93197.1 YihY/virulence factor BrkB family protein [Flammeovirga agarivorans]
MTKKDLHKKLEDNELYKKIIEKLSTSRVPHTEVSFYTFGIALIHRVDQNDLLQRGQAIAFSFSLAMLPFIIFFSTLISYIPFESIDMMFKIFREEMLPEYVYQAIEGPIQDLSGRSRGGLLSFGFIGATYVATTGMRTLMNAFNSCYHLEDKRSLWKQFQVALNLTFLFIITLCLSSFLLISGKHLLEYLHDSGYLNNEITLYMLLSLRFLIVVGIFFFNITLIFRYAPSEILGNRVFTPGSIVATILSIIVSILFEIYLDTFNSYDILYGSLGAIMGLMGWIFTIAMILLIGFQINTTIEEAQIWSEANPPEEFR